MSGRNPGGKAQRVRYDRKTGSLAVPPGFAVRITRLGYVPSPRDAGLCQAVPARRGAVFALHPDNWKSTFTSLTGKDPRKIAYYSPRLVPLAGALIAEMAFANRFQRGDDEALALYAGSIAAVSGTDVKTYTMPELILPPGSMS